MTKSDISINMKTNKIISVIRGNNAYQAIEVAKLCIEGGIKNIEITFTNPEAADAIKQLKNKYTDSHTLIGAGSILDHITARIAILSGADFVIGPSFNPETAKVCNTYHKPYIPGCTTVTEIITAYEYGVETIKLFPSNFYGINYIKAIKAPIPHLSFMATGGINLENIDDWITAGADLIGIGNSLTQNTSTIKKEAKKYIQKIK